jgi:PAS domain S-box-containing protein
LKEAAEEASLALKEERDTITAMKDALKVGLFFMDKNFIIQDHYSSFLESVLEVENLGGKKFTDLLSASMSPKEITSLMEYFVVLFNRSLMQNRGLNKQMMEKLNPIQELAYISPKTGKEKNLQWTFVPVDRGDGKLFILGNIQDITAKKQLETQLAKEEAESREEINSLLALLRSDANIIKELERLREQENAFSRLIDKILILKEEN